MRSPTCKCREKHPVLSLRMPGKVVFSFLRHHPILLPIPQKASTAAEHRHTGGQAEGQGRGTTRQGQSPGGGEEQSPPGRAELHLPILRPRPLQKQQNQGLGGLCSSPEDGKQGSIWMLHAWYHLPCKTCCHGVQTKRRLTFQAKQASSRDSFLHFEHLPKMREWA